MRFATLLLMFADVFSSPACSSMAIGYTVLTVFKSPSSGSAWTAACRYDSMSFAAVDVVRVPDTEEFKPWR